MRRPVPVALDSSAGTRWLILRTAGMLRLDSARTTQRNGAGIDYHPNATVGSADTERASRRNRGALRSSRTGPFAYAEPAQMFPWSRPPWSVSGPDPRPTKWRRGDRKVVTDGGTQAIASSDDLRGLSTPRQQFVPPGTRRRRAVRRLRHPSGPNPPPPPTTTQPTPPSQPGRPRSRVSACEWDAADLGDLLAGPSPGWNRRRRSRRRSNSRRACC
jgi:hypothetical protein